MTATTVEQAIASIITSYRDTAFDRETEAKRALAAACTEGGQYALADYMNDTLTAEANAAPWHYAALAITHYQAQDEADEPSPSHIIKGVRAAHDEYMVRLIKNGPAPHTSSPMTNLAEQLKYEGLRKFVVDVAPLLDRVK